ARRLAAAARLNVPEAGKGQRFLAALGAALMDLDNPRAALPVADGPAADNRHSIPGPAPAQAATLRVPVPGTPVLTRGLWVSVDQNQLKIFFMTMALVLVIVLTLYRSFWSALLAMMPVSLTLLVIYGGMGLIGVHLDIGTSMLASLT